ncbi:threonine/homoserine/homoserine lactone efflux protein [Pseudochelatococcus lubricantis]|uniref:Threonine/homoserine/homoserine lactone efflux protein n=1 Tax=Pseudochelatococcus lubricantis TaxID=1538102 RepID=A0ABX0V010_9HYPH|nr:LysE family transporter [Pseudochelatococcus lubricantis]NIJ58547.1 threonine/homoserine/homoserine lactone efflux protein [Pseudochelatococcus lubricantis]
MVEFLPQLLTLAGVMLLACISPGPDFIAVTSHSLLGRRFGLGAALGVSAACAMWAVLAVFGFGVLLSKVAWAYDLLRLLGAAYLVYLGIRMFYGLRHGGGVPEVQQAKVEGGDGGSAFWPSARRGLLVGMTNPKSAAFFGSLFVTVLPVNAPQGVYMATVAIVAGVAFGWFSTLAVIFSSRSVRMVYARLRRPFDAVMGAALIGLGVKLAVGR